MSRLADAGVSIDLPTGWEGRIRRVAEPAGGWAADAAAPTRVLLHAASFALPTPMGDYGSGAVERMGPPDVLLCLLESDPEEASLPVFARTGVPRVRADDLSPTQMQRPIAGLLGAQMFFQEAGRTFCLYVVVGSTRGRDGLARTADGVVQTLVIEPA